MRYLNLLTIVLMVLKLTHVINISWWLVLTPTLVYIVLLFLIFVLAVVLEYKGYGGK
jgi:hypothetical protein